VLFAKQSTKPSPARCYEAVATTLLPDPLPGQDQRSPPTQPGLELAQQTGNTRSLPKKRALASSMPVGLRGSWLHSIEQRASPGVPVAGALCGEVKPEPGSCEQILRGKCHQEQVESRRRRTNLCVEPKPKPRELKRKRHDASFCDSRDGRPGYRSGKLQIFFIFHYLPIHRQSTWMVRAMRLVINTGQTVGSTQFVFETM
jgi:hypothetical protein